MSLSRRTKVRRQLTFAQAHLDGAMMCLQKVDEIANEESDKISENIPKFVVLIDSLQKLFEQFRKEL